MNEPEGFDMIQFWTRFDDKTLKLGRDIMSNVDAIKEEENIFTAIFTPNQSTGPYKLTLWVNFASYKKSF